MNTEHLAGYPVSPATYANRGCRCGACTRANTERCTRYQRTPKGRAYKLNWHRERSYRERQSA